MEVYPGGDPNWGKNPSGGFMKCRKSDTVGFECGSGMGKSWTDYTGPVAVMRDMGHQGRGRCQGGNLRDTPMGNSSRQTLPRDRSQQEGMMMFDDEDNDPQEFGGVAQRDGMISTENREAHLDPSWKGLPKSLSADRKLKKLRKGYVNPRENYI